MNFTEDQKRVIDARNSDLLVSAAAGSGKTAVLVERVIQMLSDKEHPIDVDNLLVVTFTKAAASQMKEKIGKALEKKLQTDSKDEHLIRQINYLEHANILTIDSFCYQLVKEYFYLLDIDPGVRVGEAGELGLLRQEIMEQVIEQFYEKNPDFVAFSDVFSADKSDERMEDYIEKIYDVSASYPRPFLWTAEARKELSPEKETEFLQLPYVKDYFTEIRSSALGVKEHILSALELARGIDGPLHLEKTLLADLELVDSILSAKTYTQFVDLQGVKFSRIATGKKGTYSEEAADRIKKARDKWKDEIKKLLAVFDMPMDKLLARMKQQSGMLTALLDLVDCFRIEFEKAKLERNILEFSDVEHYALKVLSDGYDEQGMPIPSKVAKELSEQFAEILVDEYQDSNFLQEAILSCVSKHHEGLHNIFMVGDVKQSIYSFRMARPDLFMDKYHTYLEDEGAECRKLLLKNNFRSRANVLHSINYLFYQLMGEDLGGIEYTDDEALVPGRDFPEGVDDSVEIMLGESKDFVFLSDGDSELSAKKEENLDENLEDIGRMELEASMVSKRIMEMMGQGGCPHLMVTEEDGIRPLRYGDIVLLFRAPAAFSGVFSETLMSHGIPVAIQNEKGYFDTVEIRGLLSLLRALDNPLNELELAATLRGYFCGLDSNELAMMALLKRELSREKEVSLYDVLRIVAGAASSFEGDALGKTTVGFSDYEKSVVKSLTPKCVRLYELLEKLAGRQANSMVSELIIYLYSEMGYEAYVSVMPEGQQRQRNLNLFLNEARAYEKKSFGSLFAFLSYIDRLEKKEILLGGDPTDDFTEDAVRIMSIHKSKGLEFPVVFLAGMGKQFNLMDTKTPLIIHPDYHLGAKYRDADKRCGSDMFSRKAIAARMVTECIAEELRIFYVGLTRAKDKLIMTGVTPDIVAQIQKYEELAGRDERSLSYCNVHTARSYLDFVVMSMLRNPSFHDAMWHVRKRMDKKGENILSAEYENRCPITAPECNFCVSVYDFQSLLVRHMSLSAGEQGEREKLLADWDRQPEEKRTNIDEVLAYTYDRELLTKQRTKMSVTEIKRMYEVDDMASDVLYKPFEKAGEYIPPLPEFVAGNQPLSASERGTWVHKTMELLDFATVESKKEIETFLETARKDGRVLEETREFIDGDMIWNMLISDLGKRMREAAKQGMLYKEKQFVVGVPAASLLPEPKENTKVEVEQEKQEKEEFVVVQGIIDAYFQEEDKLILVDYKTDRVAPGQEELLKKRYHTQLRYYKDTLEQLTGLPVAETYIYAFSLNKEIRLF